MKLRFHKNTLRLRLSQSEVARVAEQGSIEDRVEFPNDQSLTFSLESGESASARFEDRNIRVVAPRLDLRHWIESDQEGIQFECAPLKVLIEKDFQCLHQSTPDDGDTYPNPMVDRF